MTAEIRFRIGDATTPVGDGPKLVAHINNDIGGWGRGFVLALSARWPEPERHYKQWYADRASNNFALGAVQLVQVEPDIWIANMVGQRDIVNDADGTPPVRYDAIEEALATLADEAYAMDASVHMPRIGCGLAGGHWPTVEAIINRTLLAKHIPTTVYDLPS